MDTSKEDLFMGFIIGLVAGIGIMAVIVMVIETVAS